MRHYIRLLTATGMLLGTTAIATAPVQAGGQLSANLGILSSYVSRGIPLSNDKLSFSPGLHYQNENGFYTGFRSYTTGGTEPFFEVDAYAGLGGALPNGLGYDFSLYSYQFPDQQDFGTDHFEEIAVKARYGMVEVAYNRFMNSIVKGDQYYSIEVKKQLTDGWSVGALAGHNNYASRNDPENLYDYNNYQLSAGWKDFTMAVDYNDNKLVNDETKVSLGWRKYFNF